jgi:ribosomal protein S21
VSAAAKPFVPLQVTAEECGDGFEKMLRRFVRRTREDGILGEVRGRRGFVKPCQQRRRTKKIVQR